MLIRFFVVGWNDFDVVDGARGAVGIFYQAVESRFGVFIDGANGGDQAGIEKRFDAGAELLGGLFRGAGDFVDHGAAAILASRAIFRVESGQRGADAVSSFRDSKVDLHFCLTAELFESAGGSSLHERAGLRNARVELRGSFACDHARGFHYANQLTIGNAIGRGFKLFRGLAQRFVEAATRLRFDFASGFRR